jgi:hypothetical protein
MKTPLPILGVILLATTACVSAPLASDAKAEPWLAHDVYFDLTDDSAESHDAFVQSCWDKLAKIDGVRFFACGKRDVSLDRPVNDQEYDISLHVVFESRAAHDAYQTHPDHLALVDMHKTNWSGVRVFDSLVQGEFTP